MGSRVKQGKGLQKMMKCLCLREPLKGEDKKVPSAESLAIKEFYSPTAGRSGIGREIETGSASGNIGEVELFMRESGILDNEEARALLAKDEYQDGNIEAALRIYERINIGAVTHKIRIFLAKSRERRKKQSHYYATPPMSIYTAGLMLEAVFLKAKCLQHLGRFEEAAQTCKVILDIVESSSNEGLPQNFGGECKFQETLRKAVELLPEFWKLTESPREVILSYRRAILHQWNLDAKTIAKIQKEFVIFLLYSGGEAIPSNLRSHMDSSFVPKSNLEEAILLLMILLRKISLNKIEWDPSILDHLSFALSVSGDLSTLANQWEELLPGTINRRERYHALALCYYGAGNDLVALNLLRKLLSSSEDPKHVSALLMASKICCEHPDLAKDGSSLARKVLDYLDGKCDQLESLASFLLGVSLSAHSKFAISDSERFESQSEALHSLETASKVTRMSNPLVIYYLSLECAEQRKLDDALHYAKCFLDLEGGSNVQGWLLLARILSAQKQFLDAESIVNDALDQTGIWDQGELLRTKAKLQIAQGQLKSAIETYTQLLAILLVQRKSFGSRKKLYKDYIDHARNMEVEIWHDLAYVYISLSRWHDAEVCLSKSKAIKLYSASRCHAIGTMYETKGLYKEALKVLRDALSIDPDHVPSLISTAVVLRMCSDRSNPAIRSFLMDALRHDRFNVSAWYNLGILHKDEGSMREAAECFETANFLEESAPVEPFR
ncbi:protein NPGR2 isoform X1 [Cajanus cajan]|uniref:Tetratricopeptide repeat protein 7A n=1 Tax=Cajanus cajan TaxID=3821 RepID=A0A151T5X5_CAJCA|nr:protein NPGR2 isoform X1 [Cajanus cajan]XP_020221244.1 protein NPGR2 isoform X1 [Cajanus cajan]KYP62431.1 Tetratricopeptide repeat protein 7A [Cajanus cajan]